MKSLRKNTGEQGLTLIEIMVVLVILALMMTFLGGRIFGVGDKAKAKMTQLRMQDLKLKIEEYKLNYNTLPAALDDLARCNDQTGPGCIPLLSRESDLLKDAWGQSFAYNTESQGRQYRLKSLGADGQIGGTEINYDIEIVGP